jgi:hypothetical protein
VRKSGVVTFEYEATSWHLMESYTPHPFADPALRPLRRETSSPSPVPILNKPSSYSSLLISARKPFVENVEGSWTRAVPPMHILCFAMVRSMRRISIVWKGNSRTRAKMIPRSARNALQTYTVEGGRKAIRSSHSRLCSSAGPTP